MGLARHLSAMYFRASKWKFAANTELPSSGAILIGAPHTSNWDFALMLALAGQLGIRLHFLAKDNLFWWPLGPILKALGGIPVNRRSSQGLVSQMADYMRANPGSVLALTPKGTRGKRDYWHSGFYRIAQEANLPILMASVDSKTRTLEVGPLIAATGDVKADMEIVREFYAGKQGIRPHLTSEPRLRGED